MRNLLLLFAFLLSVHTATQAQHEHSWVLSDGVSLQDHNRRFDLQPHSQTNTEWAPFYHGVASGDPLSDRVIIWTRVTPDTFHTQSIEVAWRVADDVELQNIVASGTVVTDANKDFTVKVDVTGLSPGTTYYYGFTALNAHSLTGRTKTTPVGDQSKHLKFAVVSCSNYQAGYFNAYHHLSVRNDLDAVIHLGDYIYEYRDTVYGNDSIIEVRPLVPEQEIVTLDEYRARYSIYRLDTALSRMHQQHPVICVCGTTMNLPMIAM